MRQGFVKLALACPELRVADCAYNADEMLRLMRQVSGEGASILVFPELGLTGYTCGDLFLQDALLEAAKSELERLVRESAGLELLIFAGLPLAVGGKLYNCCAVFCDGHLLGLVPKTHLPSYAEFYEQRHFSPAPKGCTEIALGSQRCLFGTDQIFRCDTLPELAVAVELCEDLWVLSPPSARHAANGATVIVNLSASTEGIGKEEYRRELVKTQSARCVCAYAYAGAGGGESTQDVVFSGHGVIAENGAVLAEHRPFAKEKLTMTEVDVRHLSYERRRMTTFGGAGESYAEVPFHLTLRETPLTRHIDPQPFVPSDSAQRNERCGRILDIQTAGLRKRIEHTHAKSAVLGISGGLDSTLALLVTVRAFDAMERPRSEIVAVTMPCFGTTSRTRSNAETLCRRLGTNFRCVDIGAAVERHFADIGHAMEQHDVVFENAQARERTQVLMDLANQTDGLVVGTGDLSELALGWATYNGDHMSMYGVNASVPKTLVRHIVEFYADTAEDPELAAVLRDILDTPISPELLPAEDDEIGQKTEELVGPYLLHDFFLYNVVRCGYDPVKTLRLACIAFAGQFSRETILHWLRSFYRRFFAQQFKRSCLPDGPKVGSAALSPRGDWRMPSDALATVWLRQLENL